MDVSSIAQYSHRYGGLRTGIFIFLLLLIVSGFVYWSIFDEPPSNFPIGKAIVIEEGSSLRQATEHLAEENVVRSALYLQFMIHTHFDSAFIQPGSYTFSEPLTVIEVAEAITSGAYSSPLDERVVTFPEGFRIQEMHTYLPEAFADADLQPFLKLEGYLFPDTYFIKKNDTIEDIVALMQKNFDTRIAPLEDEIKNSHLTLSEIVTLASILEREGKSERSMRTIAGILLTRLEENMPLQVDAAFGYILGKTSAELTQSDLALDSPYNTYKNRGLPPTPISNPGLIAIRAVLDPIRTDYYYYLSDSDGNFHYARTFDGHKENKARYLR